MESYYSLTDVKKMPHKHFNFYLNLLEEKDSFDFYSPIFNMPKIPLIGSKSYQEKNQYSHNIGKILSLICFQINICQGDEKNEIEHDFSDFKLPFNIKDYLNIDEVIEIDNNTDEPNNTLFFMPKKKLNFYLVFSQIPIYEQNKEEIKEKKEEKKEKKKENNEIKEENEIIEENEIKEINENNIINMKDDKDKNNINQINFVNEEKNENTIDYNNKFDDFGYYENYENYENNNYNNENDKDFEKKFRVYNIIPQFFYINNNEKTFYEIKNMNFQEQITLFNLSNNKYYDIETDQFTKKEFIDINNLRAENSNIILDANNKLIFQDNLKFYLNIVNDISQFYLIYTSYKNDYHSVFYYITCNNDESSKKMEMILNKSQNLKELIDKMENEFENKQVVSNLKKIFKKYK